MRIDTELSTIELCARDVSRWFTENALLLNPAKTEAIFFGTRQRLSQLNTSQGNEGIDVAGTHIQFTDAVKLLGVTLDSTLSFDKHVADVTLQCHYHIRALKHISQSNLDKLQRVQNVLVRVTADASWSVSATDPAETYTGCQSINASSTSYLY